jgi:hypothetical protein
MLEMSVEIESLPSNIVAIIPTAQTESFFVTKPRRGSDTWMEVLEQVRTKLSWEKLNVTMAIKTYEEFNRQRTKGDVAVLIGFNESDPAVDVGQLRSQLSAFRSVAAFECSEGISRCQNFGDFDPFSLWKGLEQFFDDNIDKTSPRRKARLAYEVSEESWSRRSSDDILFLIEVLVDTFSKPIKSVQSVTSTEATGLTELSCMCGNCANEMINCFKNPTCRKALACLNKCRGNDQVCAYRCITSHETQDFENFARCILQRNNCMKNSASIPQTPNPAPLSTFRGQPLTHEVALQIFEGHLAPRPRDASLLSEEQPFEFRPQSWMVVCGQNPAYDYFSCQHQIFYKDANSSNVVWYDPVFKVVTLAGEEVWRRRHYRVRKAQLPGQFYFSVLDNGVMSNEFWRILDCADDLSWGVFYYAGAASAAGTNYRGALIVSPDGKWPTMTDDTYARIESALGRGGIKLWEMFEVSNTDCGAGCAAGPPPLGYL